MDWLKTHAIQWTTSAALTLAGLRLVTPPFIDFVIDGLTVGLVYLAARLARR